MPVPDFTENGILPAGIHECSLLEAAQFLCLNERRTEIWTGLTEFLNWSDQFPNPTALLIDGSYVTDKALPGDVDLVVDITACLEPDQAMWFEAWEAHHEHVKQNYLVDFYPVVVGDGNDFSAFFQYVRVEEALRRGIAPNIRKGILRVEL